MGQTIISSSGTDSQILKKLMASKLSVKVSFLWGKKSVKCDILGDQDVKCTMMFMLNHEPAQFKVHNCKF